MQDKLFLINIFEQSPLVTLFFNFILIFGTAPQPSSPAEPTAKEQRGLRKEQVLVSAIFGQ
jgi:hypothetical protein